MAEEANQQSHPSSNSEMVRTIRIESKAELACDTDLLIPQKLVKT